VNINELIEDLDEMVELLNNDDSVGIVSWLVLSNSAAEIREMLERQLTDKWIPVSEKLPDKVGWYLVTNDEYKVDLGHWFFNEGWKEGRNSKTIAWKPLPEQYKAD